ncbi:hypothetical protein Holit_01766 [Hollandina sp. SP2]
MKTAHKRYKEWVIERAQATRSKRKEHYNQVLSKEKVETYDDIIGLYYGLTETSREHIVYHRILELVSDGFSPQVIMELLQYKKKKV